jgi:hypothetical protein
MWAADFQRTTLQQWVRVAQRQIMVRFQLGRYFFERGAQRIRHGPVLRGVADEDVVRHRGAAGGLSG